MRKFLTSLLGLVLFMAPTFAQTIEVTGKVTDASGAPIPGATIKVKGTRTGTSASSNGSFKINASPKATLQFSAVGFESKDVAVNNLTEISVSLTLDTKSLSEVVVTGTGVATSKKKTAFAVEAITADKLPAAPTADIGNALVGKIAGAQFSSVGGSPGQPVNILLRGINSITGGTLPMILLDGIEVRATSLETLDLNGIERIEVVQGAAAASLYGAQGANGVIQLFSKRGRQGKLNIDVTSSIAVNELLNIGDVNKAKNHAFNVNANGEVVSGGGVPLSLDPVTGSYLTNPVFNLISASSINNKPYGKNLLWYDHYKMFFQKANTYNNSISINGAKDKFDFSFILSDNRQETVFKNNGEFRRTNVTGNIGVELFKNLKFRSTTQLVNTRNTLLDPTGRNMFYAINNSRPFANYEQRDEAGFHSPYFGDAVGVNGYNFNYIIENARAKDKTVDIIQNFNLNYKFPKFVEVDVKYGLNRSDLSSRYEIADQQHSEGAAYWEYWAEYYSPRTSFASPTTSAESGEINNYSYISLFQNFNANAAIRFDLEKDFRLKIPVQTSTLVGWDYRKRNDNEYWSYGSDAPDFRPYNASSMANFKVQRDNLFNFTTYGLYVNQKIDWGNLAGIGGGFRSDYSSAFGRGSKPFTFPNGNAYVRPSSLDFWQRSKISSVISEWKLRAAYGEAGIQPGFYDRFPFLNTATIGNQSGLSTPVTNANPDLRIQVSKELEIGTDFGFKILKGNWLQNANLSFTYWDRTSEDVIDRVDVAPSLGVGRLLTNAMALKSNGIQASLNLNVLSSKNLTWNFTTNFAKQKSIVESVEANAEVIKTSAAGSSQYVIKAGEQIGQIYGYVFLSSVDQVDAAGNSFIPKNDQALYEVASNGYVVNKTTRQPFASAGRFPLGDPNPKFNMSFINELNYKGYLTLAFQWDWIYKSYLYNQTKQWMYRDGIHKDYDMPVTINGQTEAWTAFYRGAYAVRQANGTKSYFMEDATFFRLRNISLGFDVAKFVKIKGISRMQLLLTGRNLITITDYTGMDPEVSSGTNNSSWDRAVDHNTIPNIKTYQVGLNISF
jgi:TonB-dependent starch-binding outer membrane protein SusC